ncbi:hypothetical protein [Nonomuraea dietziae]|uniref:hypothetical protein n=1 Tax=Nonomuraea dietziae TaxID=65515 RepID=UPI0031DC66F0
MTRLCCRRATRARCCPWSPPRAAQVRTAHRNAGEADIARLAQDGRPPRSW